MLKNPFDVSLDRLPGSIPVFPTENSFLLPGGQVHLHFFEPRYISMVQDALSAQDRIIGLAIPKASQSISKKEQQLNKTGCAGRITSFEETPDGHFLITLTGYCRFDMADEINTMRGYRRFSVSWEAYAQDISVNPNPDMDRDELVKLLKKYVGEHAMEMDWNIIKETPNFNLITFFSMNLPFDNEERQKLLEASTSEERSKVLIELIRHELDDIESK